LLIELGKYLVQSVKTKDLDSDLPSRGRPRLSQDIARTKRVVTFLTAHEFAVLKEIAASRSSSLSATCHELLGNVLSPPNLAENQKQKSNSNET